MTDVICKVIEALHKVHAINCVQLRRELSEDPATGNGHIWNNGQAATINTRASNSRHYHGN